MTDTPLEKPDPVKDYEAYKVWRASQKGGAKPAAAPAAASSAAATGQPSGEDDKGSSVTGSAPAPSQVKPAAADPTKNPVEHGDKSTSVPINATAKVPVGPPAVAPSLPPPPMGSANKVSAEDDQGSSVTGTAPAPSQVAPAAADPTKNPVEKGKDTPAVASGDPAGMGEKPDPVKDYEAYKKWKAAQKAGGGAPAAKPAAVASSPAAATAAAGAANPGQSPAADAPAADPNVWPPPDRPNPLTNYADYKTWKAKRKAGKGGAAAAPAAAPGDSRPRKKVMPHAAKFKKVEVDRRNVLLSFGGLVWLLFTGCMGLMGTLVLRFFFPNVLYEKPTSFKIGAPDQFLPNEVSEAFKQTRQIWVVRDSTRIFILKSVCTHLGCTPNWLTAERKFKCPCHGSGFRMSGMNFEGPAPRPLERYKVSLADDGQLLVDTTKAFLNEAQWEDAEASVMV